MYRMPNPASLSQTDRMEYRRALAGTRYNGVTPEVLEDGSAIFITDDGSRFYLQAFGGKALRSCRRVSGYYRTAVARAEAIERFKQARAGHHTAQLLRRQAAKQPHTLEVGAILNTCWGYEQTNVEFYQVVAVRGSMVELRELEASIEETGAMSGRKTPRPDHFTGAPFRRRVAASDSVKIDSTCRASVWSGRPVHVSWYG